MMEQGRRKRAKCGSRRKDERMQVERKEGVKEWRKEGGREGRKEGRNSRRQEEGEKIEINE